MNRKLKQRAEFELLTKKGCSAVVIYARLENVYGNSVIDLRNTHRWLKKVM